MRIRLLLAGLAAAAATAFPAAAQDGEYAGALTRMLTEAAAGRCPADVMGEALLTACNEQIAGMAPALTGLGAIEETSFVRAEEVEGVRYETWNVKFAGGRTLVWRIGGLHDGRFTTAGTVAG